jgi:hypothetical protein
MRCCNESILIRYADLVYIGNGLALSGIQKKHREITFEYYELQYGSTGYGQSSMTGFCERDNATLDYNKTENFLIRLINNNA